MSQPREMSEFRKWQAFWSEVLRMWRKEHGFNVSLLWKLSPWMTLIGIIGIFALEEPWKTASWVLFGIGVADLVASLCFVFPYIKWSKDKEDWNTRMAERDARIAELVPMEEYKKQQIGHEEEWLYPILEYIDIEKRGSIPEDQIIVRFNFDSGLVYDFQPYRMWVSPMLGNVPCLEARQEIPQPPNFLRGKRSQQSTVNVTIKGTQPLKLLDMARQDPSTKRGVMVEIQLRRGEFMHQFSIESH